MDHDGTQQGSLVQEIKPVIGMIHVGALPGTPRHHRTVAEIVADACAEVEVYQQAGVNCLMIENMHDVPYLRGSVGPEIVAAITMVAQAVRSRTHLPIGLQILAAADQEALAVAHAASLDFIRCECFAFAHVADEGIMESNAARLLRFRRTIGATEVQIWADIKKKHAAHAWTADLSLGDAAEAAEFMGAETIIVTGTSTGHPPRTSDVEEARMRCGVPVFVGSGVTLENAADFLAASDGVIVGSYFKRDGYWGNSVDAERVRAFMAEAARWQIDPVPASDGAAAVTSAGTRSIPAPPPRLTVPRGPQHPI
jgi:uncharacterized protein